MILQILSSLAYQIVEQSWIIATVLVKYFLVFLGLKIIKERNFELNHISEQLLEYSDELVALIVFLGITNVFVGIEISALFTVFSQVTAFLYFAYLFWKY